MLQQQEQEQWLQLAPMPMLLLTVQALAPGLPGLRRAATLALVLMMLALAGVWGWHLQRLLARGWARA
jgi:hypothetical protein